MIYSTLIRRLVSASIEARYGKYDIADRLADRCLPETSIIRKMLMNAVCDPRFKLHVNQVRGWKTMAKEGLENLARLLVSIPDLSEGQAEDILNEFLNEWMIRMLSISNERDRKELTLEKTARPRTRGSAEEEDREEQSPIHYEPKEESDPMEEMQKALDGFEYNFQTNDNDRPASIPSAPSIKSPEEKRPVPVRSNNDPSAIDNEDDLPRNTSSEENESQMETESQKHHQGYGGYEAESSVTLEDRFLSHIPPSLVKLAKLIGRADNDEMEPSGHFPSASKCDIAGVSTGNDLSSVLPSELALLADPRTDSLFFKNYVTKKLQVFSSVSRGHRGKKRQDGPIIICLDTSSSMTGEPMLVAKALTIAVCIIAQRKHRKVMVVKYSETQQMYSLWNLAMQRKDFMRFLSIAASGGNDEDSLFRYLTEDVIPYEGDYKTADILCVSDFGWGCISSETVVKINEEKKKGLRIYGLNIGERGYLQSDFYENLGSSAPDQICDSLWSYSRGVCREEKKPSIRNRSK